MMKIRAEQTFPLEGRINMDQLECRCNIDGMCEAYVDETQAQWRAMITIVVTMTTMMTITMIRMMGKIMRMRMQNKEEDKSI